MNYIKVKKDSTKIFNIIDETKFKISLQFIWSTQTSGKIEKIKLNISNQDTANYAYEYLKEKSYVCHNFISNNNADVLEIFFVKKTGLNSYNIDDEKVTINNPVDLKINIGSILFTHIVILDNTDPYRTCSYSEVGFQPKVTKGNILIGN